MVYKRKRSYDVGSRFLATHKTKNEAGSACPATRSSICDGLALPSRRTHDLGLAALASAKQGEAMPNYKVRVEVEAKTPSRRVQDEWDIVAKTDAAAKAQADADFAARKMVHAKGTLRLMDEVGNAFERPFVAGGQQSDWS